jgi:hypothetical protein
MKLVDCVGDGLVDAVGVALVVPVGVALVAGVRSAAGDGGAVGPGASTSRTGA